MASGSADIRRTLPQRTTQRPQTQTARRTFTTTERSSDRNTRSENNAGQRMAVKKTNRFPYQID
jgi:hypothetical protein